MRGAPESSIGEGVCAVRLHSSNSLGRSQLQLLYGSSAGRPVKLLWKTNRELPRYFMTQPGRVV